MRQAIDSLFSAVVLSAILSPHFCEAVGRDNGSLRRKRNEDRSVFQLERKPVTESEFNLVSKGYMKLAPEDHMEDLWNRAMAVDESMKLDERILQMSASFSMPTGPTTPRPSPNAAQSPSGSSLPSMVPSDAPSRGSKTPTEDSKPPTEDCLSGTTREEYIKNALSRVTEASALEDPSSPQSSALAWISGLDPMEFDPCTYPTIEQRYGLATFYFATIGNDWIKNDNWLSAKSECEWFGVTCAEPGNAIVEKLQLPLNGVAGTIPNEISTLYDILRIDLFGNSVGSSLPTGLGNLTKLELLDLEENDFDGTLFTPEVMSLVNLVGLRTSFNKFTGTIPSKIDKFDMLEQLWFADNKISGTIPKSVTKLKSLESIFGYSNLLEGKIPVGFGKLVNLTQIRMYDNSLTGELPSDLFDATNLETIRLDSNKLTGSIPTTVGKLLGLEDLRLFSNTLFGDIPSEIGNLLMLQNLILNNNFFAGTLAPETFNPSGAIEFLDFSNNQFLEGSLPSTLFDLTSVRFIYIANCSLTGTIPSNFGNPPKLRDLYLDGNSLVGTIPDPSDGQLEKLNELLLQSNDLTGSMPKSICALRDKKKGSLEDLWSNCLGNPPQIACAFPDCCNRCFGK